MNRTKQKGAITLGLVIIAILAGIVLLLGLLFWSSSQNTLANTCQTNLKTLQTQYNSWRLACLSNDSATQSQLLTSMNTLITQWNAGQCSKFGKLPTQPASCPPVGP